jgi:hypothetical protein
MDPSSHPATRQSSFTEGLRRSNGSNGQSTRRSFRKSGDTHQTNGIERCTPSVKLPKAPKLRAIALKLGERSETAEASQATPLLVKHSAPKAQSPPVATLNYYRQFRRIQSARRRGVGHVMRHL